MSDHPEPAPPGADDYERKYMAGGGQPLHREKMLWRMHWLLLMWVPLCLALAGVLLAGVGSNPAPLWAAALPLGMSGLFAFLWALFAVLRVHVSDTEVHIQYGLFGPRIPIAAIESCHVIDYDLKRFGGWGVRRAVDGTWAYSLMGDSAQVVEIAWRDGDRTRKAVVSSPDPITLTTKIRQARSKAEASARVRVRGDAVAQLQDAVAEEQAVDSPKQEDSQRKA